MDTTQKNRPRQESANAPQKRKAAANSKAQPSRASQTKTTQKKAAASAARQRTARKQRTKPEEDVSAKKRAYGNSKPKKKSNLQKMSEALLEVKETNAKRAAAKKSKSGKRTKRPSTPTPAVIYTDPVPFNRNRLVIQLTTVVAVVLAMVMGLSVFFKVEKITVTGAEVYSAWTVREASGISEGDNLLTFSKARACGQITAKLPYVQSVRIGIKLPNTVNIIIEEADVVYAIKSYDGTWWLMNSNGKVVDMADSSTASKYTQVLGVTLENPVVNEFGTATEDVPAETDESGEYVSVSVTGAARLNAALRILQALEDNDIVGGAASVNVSNTEDIILWYGSQYQVNLGDTSQLEYKVACMNDCVLQMSDYQSGILDISFTTWANQVMYTPFE